MKFIPQITPFDQINGKLNSYGQNLSFTIFDSEKNYYNSSIIAEIYSALYGSDRSKPIADLVSFRPSRIIDHEIIVALTTTIKLNDLKGDLTTKFSLVKNSIDTRDLENVHSIAMSFAKLSKEIDVNFRSDYKPGKFVSNITLDELKNIIVATKVANDYLREAAKTKVKKAIDFYAEEEVLELLPVFAASERSTFTINGATAVGKSSSEELFKKHIRDDHNLSWDSIAKINGDSYKYILEPGGFSNSELFSQLIQPEINLLYLLINQRLMRIIETGHAPHVFFDKVFLHNDNINQALLGGAKLEGILVDAPIEQALVRAEIRGALTGRYEDGYNIFNNHASISQKFVNFLSKYQGNQISYVLFDNSKNLTKTAEVDLADKKISIFDNDKFFGFLGKAKLNISGSIINNQIIYNQINIEDELYNQILADYKKVDYCLSDFDF